jgi:hypothetical protein
MALRNAPLSEAVGTGLAYGLFALVYFAALPTLVIGVPLFLWLQDRIKATATPAILVGAVLGAAPYGLMMLLPLVLGDRVANIDSALPGIVRSVVAAGLFGGFGGWTFWFVAAWNPPRR